MMNSTQNSAGRRPSTIHRQLGNDIYVHFNLCHSSKGTQEQSDTHVSANDMCAPDEWPSHARRNHAQLQNESDGQKKKGRGVLKGFKSSKKRFANGFAKLILHSLKIWVVQ